MIPSSFLDGPIGFNTSRLWVESGVSGVCTCPKTPVFTDLPFREMLRLTFQKGWSISLFHMQSLGDGIVSGLRCSLTKLSQRASQALEWFLWATLLLYYSIIWRTISFILSIMASQFPLIAAISSAVASSVVVGLALRKIFVLLQESIIIPMIRLAFSVIFLPISIWRMLRKKEIGEKALNGFLTFRVPQDPPKKSVLLLQYPSGSHAGYATCIRLLNGRNALITAAHIVDAKHGPMWVVSSRNGNKIPWSEFSKRCVIQSTQNDQLICEGPPEWESLLGCKSVNFVPATQLAKSKCSLFAYRDGGWFLRNAEFAGAEYLPSGKPSGYISTLVDTTEGDSGAPYFCGKSLVGVHVGYHLDLNANRASPVLPLRDVTIPSYVCETTAPTGRIFDQDLINLVSGAIKDIKKAEEKLRSQAGFLWSEEKDEDNADEFFEAAPQFPRNNNKKRSGNGKRGTDRVPTGEASPVLHTPAEDMTGATALDRVVKTLVDRISVKGIEEAVIRELKAKALKRGPQKKKRGSRGKNKPATSALTSSPSITGKYVPPQRRIQSPALNKSGSSPNITTPAKKENQSGGGKSSGNIPRWVRKPAASGGRNSAQQPN